MRDIFLLKVHFDSLYKYKDDQWARTSFISHGLILDGNPSR
jgi:hypothetical protein